MSKYELDNICSICLYLNAYLFTAILGLLYYKCIKQIKFKQIWAEKFCCITFKAIIALPFSFLCGFRNISVGFDTHNYINAFERMANGTYLSSQGSFAFLFEFIFEILAKITNGNGIYFLFGMALLSLVLIESAFEKVCNRGTEFSIALLLFMLYLSPVMMDQSRQFIGIGCVTLAYAYLLNEKKKLGILYILIGMLFHETAGVMLMFLLLDNRILNRKIFGIFILLFSTIIYFFMPILLQLIFIFIPIRYSYLITVKETIVIGKAWIIDLFPLVISMFIYYRYINKMHMKHNVMLEAAIWSSFLFRIAGYYSFFIMRMSYYGEALSIIAVTYVLFHVKCKNRYIYIFIVIIVHFIHWWIDFCVLGLNGALPYSFK